LCRKTEITLLSYLPSLLTVLSRPITKLIPALRQFLAKTAKIERRDSFMLVVCKIAGGK
jgi:hypothetical protein